MRTYIILGPALAAGMLLASAQAYAAPAPHAAPAPAPQKPGGEAPRVEAAATKVEAEASKVDAAATRVEVAATKVEAAATKIEASAAPPPPSAAKEPGPVLSGTHLWALTEFSTIPLVAPLITIDSLILALGVAGKYDNNKPKDEELLFGFDFYASYAIINKAPFLLHPEVAWFTTVKPGGFAAANTISAGVGFLFAPWNAPIGIGTAWDARLTLDRGKKAVFDIFTPNLRFVYLLK